MSPNAGNGGDRGCCGVSSNEYSCADGAQINFGDLIPYLTFDERFSRNETLSPTWELGGVIIFLQIQVFTAL
jgi:hypothetical protein